MLSYWSGTDNDSLKPSLPINNEGRFYLTARLGPNDHTYNLSLKTLSRRVEDLNRPCTE